MSHAEFDRQLQECSESVFLFGALGTGKTTGLKSHFPEALRIDLLEPRMFLQFGRDPSYLEALVGNLKVGSVA